MGVRHQLMGDFFARERFDQRAHMRRVSGPRVDHGHLAFADDVGAGAVQSEGARVARDESAHAGDHGLQNAVLEVQIAAECRRVGHDR